MLSSRFATALLLAALVLIGLLIRLYDITGIGVGGNDTILYYTLAERWAEGDLSFQYGDSIAVFRPVLLAFNALSLKLLGHTDYSIKLAYTLLDAINMSLIALLAWLASGRRLVVLASVATYALLPIAIWAARLELPHTLSTFFVLLSCLMAWLGTMAGSRAVRLSCMLAAGVGLSAVAMVHEELIFLAAPLGLFHILGQISRRGFAGWRYAVTGLFLFCAPLVLTIALILSQHPLRVAEALQSPVSGTGMFLAHYPEAFGRYLWNGILGATSTIFTLCVGLCIVYYLASSRSNVRQHRDFLLGCGFYLFTPVLFMALYAPFFGTVFSRGVLPLIPLSIIAVYYTLAHVWGERADGLRATFFIGMVLLFALSAMASYSAFKVGNRKFGMTWAAVNWPSPDALREGYREFLVDANYVPSYATHWRRLFDVFRDRVDSDARLLVTPSTAMHGAGRRALQTQVYLGDNAIYRLDHFEQALEDLISEKRIRYVVFTLGQSRGVPPVHRPYRYRGLWGEPRPVDLASAYGMNPYSRMREYEQVSRVMRRLGARELTLFPEGSYEDAMARVWQLP